MITIGSFVTAEETTSSFGNRATNSPIDKESSWLALRILAAA